MKKIFIYSANYLPNIGGVEKYTANLAQELTKMGNSVTIVTNNVFGMKAKEKLENGATIYRLPCFPLIHGRLPIPKPNPLYKSLRSSIFNESADLVVVNTRFYPHTFLGIRHAKKAGVKPIVIDHGSAYLTLGNSAIDRIVQLYEHMMTFFLKKNDIDFYGVSKASTEWLKTFGIEAKGVLNNSIDADSYLNSASSRNFRHEIGSNYFLVSFTGRLIPEKGVKQLVEAARMLSEKHEIQFCLAGDGPLRDELESINPGNIHFLGRLDSHDIAALLRDSDVFCLPTRSEGFSTSLLESAACYTTPVITNVGGVPEMIPTDDFGVILNTQSPKEIVDAISFLKENPTKNSTMADNIGRRVRTNFSWEKTAQLVLEAGNRAQSI